MQWVCYEGSEGDREYAMILFKYRSFVIIKMVMPASRRGLTNLKARLIRDRLRLLIYCRSFSFLLPHVLGSLCLGHYRFTRLTALVFDST